MRERLEDVAHVIAKVESRCQLAAASGKLLARSTIVEQSQNGVRHGRLLKARDSDSGARVQQLSDAASFLEPNDRQPGIERA